MLHLVGHILEYSYDARTHERYTPTTYLYSLKFYP
jgi:hypothetical protein